MSRIFFTLPELFEILPVTTWGKSREKEIWVLGAGNRRSKLKAES